MNKNEFLSDKLLYWVKVDYNLDVELYYIESKETFKENNIVIIETKHGLETGKILEKSIPLSVRMIKNPLELQKIVRIATEEDLELRNKNLNRVSETFKIANEKILEHNLPLKLLHIHHFLDDKKVMFYFYCENRVDFRSLVRDLASIFKVRIELRQVGVRDEAMFIGGYGVCGRQFCCSLIGTNKDPKSIKMAREQNLTLNSMRISGVCGRLLCCLDFEYGYYYEENLKYIKNGAEVLLNNGSIALITNIDKEKQIVTIQTKNGDNLLIPIESIIVNKESGKCYAYI